MEPASSIFTLLMNSTVPWLVFSMSFPSNLSLTSETQTRTWVDCLQVLAKLLLRMCEGSYFHLLAALEIKREQRNPFRHLS
uniref:Uncharacterized protein n=1 Tax=Salix viminalis TaxID=40686 RepID=A0A6N2L9K5_SALVM